MAGGFYAMHRILFYSMAMFNLHYCIQCKKHELNTIQIEIAYVLCYARQKCTCLINLIREKEDKKKKLWS